MPLNLFYSENLLLLSVISVPFLLSVISVPFIFPVTLIFFQVFYVFLFNITFKENESAKGIQ